MVSDIATPSSAHLHFGQELGCLFKYMHLCIRMVFTNRNGRKEPGCTSSNDRDFHAAKMLLKCKFNCKRKLNSLAHSS